MDAISLSFFPTPLVVGTIVWGTETVAAPLVLVAELELPDGGEPRTLLDAGAILRLRSRPRRPGSPEAQGKLFPILL
jgi:hypothetical protein